MERTNYTKKTVLTGLFIALCLVLPLAFHSIPNGGSIFSPMHIPVLVCGLALGAPCGLVTAVFGSLISSLITQMPPLAYLPPMMVELAVYGIASGFLMKAVRTKKYILNVYISLALSMVLGRVVAGAAKALFFSGGAFTFKMFFTSYFVTSLPGIILHFLIIPPVMLSLRRFVGTGKGNMTEFEKTLRAQYKAHPSMTAQDAVKLCFQAAYGSEHVTLDLDAAKKHLYDEFERTAAQDVPLFEQISPEVCRVNIAAWKYASLKKEWLFNMFCDCVRVKNGSPELFKTYLDIAKKVLKSCDFNAFLKTYDGGAVHHSEAYRKAEAPSYRIVDKKYINLIPLLKVINGDTRVIALEGRAASGKTTAADMLSKILDAPVVHMDDFFLPPSLRQKERFEAPGANVHHERFAKEVLPFLKSGEEFSYRVFDCGKMDFGGFCNVKEADIRIVEGAYCLHPSFGDYADITVFFDVEPDEQLRRIVARNGEQMAEMFKTRWIPLEEEYYKSCGIKEKCRLTIKS